MRALSTVQIRAFSSDTLTKFSFERWKRYFAETSADNAKDFPKVGIQPTVDVAVDTKDHPFVTDPLLALVHRVGEITKRDPFLELYERYVAETDPAKSEQLRAKIDKLWPVEFNEPKEEVLEKFKVQYLFLAEFQKLQKQ